MVTVIILVYVSKKFLKHFLAALLSDIKCLLQHDSDSFFSWPLNKRNIFYIKNYTSLVKNRRQMC